MKRLSLCLPLVVCALLGTSPAHGITVSFNGTTYATTTTETLPTVFFNNSAGVGTVQQYAGLILVEITGTGNGAHGGGVNDAFWGPLPTPHALDCGSLAVRSAPLPGGCNNFAHNRMVYSVDDNHFVSLAGSTYAPAYRPDHHYTFVISADSIIASLGQVGPQTFYFATTDGNYGDNGGFFNITVSQLTSVPEPSTWALTLLAASALIARRRRA